MSDIKVGIKLTTDGSGKVTAEITQVKKGLEETGKAAETAASKNKKAAADTKNAWNGVNDQITAAKKAFLAYVSVQAAWSATKHITATADAWTNLNSRLRVVTGTQREFATALADVSAIANRYQTDINSVGAAYNRLAPIAANMGKSQQDLRASLESVSAALKLSGASTSEASETLRQFGQALSGPTVQMEEMNTIIDSASVLWQGLQRQFPDLIRQYGSLKEAVGKGALSNRELLDATIRLREEFDAQAKTMSVTVSGALQILSNEWAKYIGATDQARGSSNELAQAILSIAKNLGTIIQPFAWFVKTSVDGWAKIIDSVNQYRIALGNVALLKEQLAKDGDFNQAITPEEWNARRTANGFATDRPRADGGFGDGDTGTARFDGINRSAQGAANSVGRLNQRVEEFSRRGAQASRNEINAYLESTTRGAEAAAQRLMTMGAVQKKVHDEAMRQGLNPAFALAIAQRESQFRQNLTSPAGAHGVMQLMPGTARRFGVDINNIDENIKGGVTYLKFLMETFKNDMRLAAAAYNAGEHRKSFNQPNPEVPPFAETQKYVGYVRRNYERWSGQLGTGGGFSDFYNDAQGKAFDTAVSRINQRMAEADAARKAQLEKIKQDLLQAEQLATQAEKNAEISIKMAIDPASQEKALKDMADAQKQRDAVIQKSINITSGVQDAKARLKAIEDELKAAQKYAKEEGKIAELQSQRKQAIAELKGAETAAQTEALKMEQERKDAQEKSATQRLAAQKDWASLNVEQQRQVIEGLQAEFDLKQRAAEYSQAVMQQYYDDQRAAIDAGLIQAQNQVTLTEAERDRALQTDDILRIGQSITANMQAQQALIDQTRQAELDKLNIAAEQLDYERQIAEWKLQQTEITKPNDLEAITQARQALVDIEAQITANAQKQLDVMNQMPKQAQGGTMTIGVDASGVTKVADELLRLNKIWDNAVEAIQEYSKTFVEAFGKTGEAVAKVADIMATYERRQKRIQQEAKEAVTKDPAKALEINQRKYAQSVANTSDLMANLSLTARGWMKEGSDGYKAMTIAAQSFAAISQAINLALGIQAVLKQLVDGDSYSALFRAIAVAAFVGSLGIAVGGIAAGSSGGGGQTRKSAEDKQKEQFTGTVLGDMTAHSESLANSLTIVAENSTADLDYSKGMLKALSNIEKLLGGAAASVASGLMNMPNLFQLGKGWDFSDIGLSSVDKTLGQYFSGGGFQGAAWGEIVKEAADGTKRYKDVYTELNGTVKGQFTRVIIGIADAVRKAGEAFGLNAGDFNKKMMDFVVSFGNVSFGDLKGDDLTKAVQEMFSNMSDQMAMAFMPGLQAFQQVGEGYFETMVRVGNGINVASGMLEAAGLKAINYQDIVLKQGDVAAEIVRQSITAYEGLFSTIGSYIDGAVGSAEELLAVYQDLLSIRAMSSVVGLSFRNLSNDMIVAAGGVSALKDSISFYLENFIGIGGMAAAKTAEVADAFRRLNVRMPETQDAFRQLVSSIDQSTSAGQKLWAQLLKLAPAFLEAKQAAQELADLRTKLKGGNPFAELDGQWKQLWTDWGTVMDGELAMVGGPFQAKIKAQQDAIQGWSQAISTGTASIGLLTGELVRLSIAKAPAAVLKSIEQAIVTLTKNVSEWQKKIKEANKAIEALNQSQDAATAAKRQEILQEQGWSLIGAIADMWEKMISGIRAAVASMQDQIDDLITTWVDASGNTITGARAAMEAKAATANSRLTDAYANLNEYRGRMAGMGQATDPTVELGYIQQIQNAIMARYNAELALLQAAQQAMVAAETERLNAELDAWIEARNQALDVQIEAINAALEAEIQAINDALDARIKAQQDADEAVIKSMQKALDARIKAQQKADEAVIKAMQKRFDAENKAIQKQFDAIIKARQKEYDAANKLMQRQFDDERKALQKKQDAQMKILTDELDAANKLKDAIKSIADYAQSLKLGANSPLSPEAKLREAQRQYQELLAKAKAGDADAMAKLSGASDAYLEAARNYYGSSTNYEDIFKGVQQAMEAIGGMSAPDPDSIQSRIDALRESQEKDMQALQDKQDAIMDTIREQQQEAIDALRETQQEQLDAIRESQQEQIDAVREAQQENIDAMREAAQDQIDAVREAQQANIEAMRKAAQDQIEAARKAAQDQIDAARKLAEKEIADERAKTQQKIADLSDPEKNQAIKELKERTVAELQALQQQARELEEKARAKAEAWINEVRGWMTQNQINDGTMIAALRGIYTGITQQPPPFARGGQALPGLAMVGEQGPEIVRFNTPGQVYTASETRSMLKPGSDEETKAILRDIKTETKASVTVQSTAFRQMIDKLNSLDDRMNGLEREARLARNTPTTSSGKKPYFST